MGQSLAEWFSLGIGDLWRWEAGPIGLPKKKKMQ